jgi:TfoX/Sxy family transcriptional regulator of competence genes
MTKTAKTAKKAPEPVEDGAFARIARSFDEDRDVSPARMFGSVGLKVKGKLFAMAVKGRLVVKLPKARVDELVGTGDGEHFDPGHGRLMKEWVSVSSAHGAWLQVAREAHRFVRGGAR